MPSTTRFKQLGLGAPLLSVLETLGYESPTPIQLASIPLLLQGKDIIAQAQTGTGKTAAFALPLLTRLTLQQREKPQALILTPTRELAIQVAEAFQRYASHLNNFHVLPIYGGQAFQRQLKALKRGVHVVVGTPGRIMDHLRRGTLELDHIDSLILDEADEMLKMGFIEDVQWILKQIPGSHQKALFSATMPPAIKKIVTQHFPNATKIQINPEAKNLPAITQYYMLLPREKKLDALTRFLEMEDIDASIIFTSTKTMSVDLAEKLAARGYSAAALNGDLQQAQREKVMDRLKRKSLDIIVATEVAARGLDVERISHVINYDIPYDAESYTHRIGRTGRAGRQGKALLFVSPREERSLKEIERRSHQKLTRLELPTLRQVSNKRIEKLTETIITVLTKENLAESRHLVETVIKQSEYSAFDVAVALAHILQKQKTNVVKEELPIKTDKNFSSPRKRYPPAEKPKFLTKKKKKKQKKDKPF